jgi:YebC/PmpR family DNA-binding regulatory protein
MAGHSKWANTKFRKAAQDKKRGKLFTKLIREITVSVKQGGPDPDSNPRLRTAIDKSFAGNLTRDAIDRAIKRATGSEEKDLEEVVYEGYAPLGVAVIVECLTDNNTRTVANIRHFFSKHGGNLGVSGSVSYLFTKQGQIFLPKDLNLPTQKVDELMEIAINAGALDFDLQADGILITTEPKDFINIKSELESTLGKIDNALITSIAANYITPKDQDEATKLITFLDNLEDLDDVQEVYSNASLDEFC